MQIEDDSRDHARVRHGQFRRLRAELSDPADHAAGPLRRRRRHRHGGAGDRAVDVETAGPDRSSIENATGAGGTIAATRASRAEPDGYTLLIHHIGISTAATLYRKLAYDTKTAFAPIGLVTNAPMTIIGRPDLPPNTLAELVTYIKANGDKMTFGNAGLGAASHLCGMLFMTAVGKEILTVPYKGNAPVMNDLIAKQIDLSCDQTTNTTGPIASKLIKAYAITTKSRLASMPDLPSADEGRLEGL